MRRRLKWRNCYQRNVNVTHAVAYLHFHLPTFIDPENWPAKSVPQSSWLFNVGCFATEVVSSEVLRRWLSEVRCVKMRDQISQDTVSALKDQLLKYWPWWLGHRMDMLNVASTEIYTKLALIVNFKRNTCKKTTVIAKISWYFERSVVTLKLRKEYLNIVIYNTPVSLRIKYWTVWYIERYSMSTYTGVTNF